MSKKFKSKNEGEPLPKGVSGGDPPAMQNMGGTMTTPLRMHQLLKFLRVTNVPDTAPVFVGIDNPQVVKKVGGVGKKMIVLPLVAVARLPEAAMVLVVSRGEADPIEVRVADLREVANSHDPNAAIVVVFVEHGTDIERIRWTGGGYVPRMVYDEGCLSFVLNSTTGFTDPFEKLVQENEREIQRRKAEGTLPTPTRAEMLAFAAVLPLGDKGDLDAVKEAWGICNLAMHRRAGDHPDVDRWWEGYSEWVTLGDISRVLALYGPALEPEYRAAMVMWAMSRAANKRGGMEVKRMIIDNN